MRVSECVAAFPPAVPTQCQPPHLAWPPAAAPLLHSLQGGLQTRPLSILKGVSGALRPGEVTLLLGPPGAGKSVLLRTLAGQLQGRHGLRVRAAARGGTYRVVLQP